jgi:hypothetical protein
MKLTLAYCFAFLLLGGTAKAQTKTKSEVAWYPEAGGLDED